jgi:hypothetical protein
VERRVLRDEAGASVFVDEPDEIVVVTVYTYFS